MKHTFLLILSLITISLLGCDSGGGADSPNTTEGSGNNVLLGTITGFGSVYVNGVRFKTNGTKFIVNDDDGSEVDLHIGMVVKVRGHYDDDTNNGYATTIEYDRDLEGPISSVNMIDAVTKELVILDATVIVDDRTRLEDVSFGDLMVGMVVEVSGYKGSLGTTHATWIKKESDEFMESRDELEVEGFVSNLNLSAMTFEINSYVIDYSEASFDDFDGELKEGMYMEVEGHKFGPADELIASEIEFEGDDFDDDVDMYLKIDGYVTPVSANEFTVNGYLVQWTSETDFENGYPHDLMADAKITVEGHMIADGTIMAKKIRFHDGAEDFARAIVKDALGNVYVTGSSKGEDTSFDYLTVKYDAAGNKIWARRYDSGYFDEDHAKAITLDEAGNVYVTGYSKGDDTDFDYATIKYSPDGMQMWFMRYDSGYYKEDYANDIVAIDGYVFVTGYSKGDDSDYDFATVSYRADDGYERWAMRYDSGYYSEDHAKAIAVTNGYVFVTGYSKGEFTDFDYATVSYSASDGTQRWVMRYDSGYYSEDSANDLVATDGYVFVTGYSRGNDTDYDYATISYRADDGYERWVMRYDSGYYGEDRAKAIAASNGYVFVTGYSRGDDSDFDYATVSYRADDGYERWAMHYDSGYYKEDFANDLVATDDSVFVTGYSKGDDTDYDYATVSYRADDGYERWVMRYDSGYFNEERATAIATSGEYVNVTGYSKSDDTDFDYATIQYDNNGNRMWIRRFDGYKLP